MINLKTIRRLWLAGLSLAMLLACRALAADAGAVGEYQVKAAFLYNFTKFVDWPGAAAKPADAPFVIGIAGDDPFGSMLDETIKSEKAAGHPLIVKRFKRGEPVGGCQILFISRSETGHLESVLKQTEEEPVLTVGDADGVAARGVMINLILVKGTVKMEINLHRAEQARLRISSKLLGLAKIVESEK